MAVPALAMVIFGRPTLASALIGIPIAVAGELLRIWAVGYSGVTTRGDHVEAPALVTAGPYAYARNPLYVGNFITAVGFAIAFTGGMTPRDGTLLAAGALALMICVYTIIVPHEEAFLREKFGAPFDAYCKRVPRVFPKPPADRGQGTFRSEVIRDAETRTFVTFGVMLAALALKAAL